MSKKRKVAKSGAVWKMTSEEAALAQKPLFNGYACGYGIHGDTKFNRAKAKRDFKKVINSEGASRGSFLICLTKSKQQLM